MANNKQMIDKNSFKWKDIVQKVQNAGVQEIERNKQEQKKLNMHYVDILEQEIAHHREQLRKRELQKFRQRQIIENQVQMEKQQQILNKLNKKNRQLEYQQSNSKILQQIKESKQRPKAQPEHPFVRLVDVSQQRQKETRQKMKMQNNINEWQHKIKMQQKKQKSEKQRSQRNQFIQFVDRFHDKKQQDRNIFKRKYLKLSNMERSNFIHQNHPSANIDIEHDYHSVNSSQIQQHQQRKMKKDHIDQVLGQINMHADVPSGSPAFIGRNPIHHDRKKQLQYLHKGIKKGVSMTPNTFKTQPNLPNSQRKKQLQNGQDLSNLQSFYLKNMKRQSTVKVLSNPSDKNIIERTQPLSQKPKRMKTLSSVDDSKGRVHTEPTEPRRQARKFMRFDIIQGMNKEVYI